MRPLSRNEVLGMLIRLTVFGAATYYSIKWVVDAMDPTSKQKSQSKKRVSSLPNLSFVWAKMIFSKNVLNLFSGRAAYEEDRRRGNKTNRLRTEHSNAFSWSTNDKGNFENHQDLSFHLIKFFPLTNDSHLAGFLERYCWSWRYYQRTTRHGYPTFSEETPFTWIQTLSAS